MSISSFNDEDIEWKFRAPNQRTLALLINQSLWFAHPKKLNDPFEANFAYEEKFKVALKARNDLNKETKEVIEHYFSDDIKYMRNANVSVLSLCQTFYPTAMWSYYAQDHSGVALGFRFDESDRSFQDYEPNSFKKNGRIKVQYFDKSQKKTFFSELIDTYDRLYANGSGSSMDASLAWMGIKSPQWQHEEEVRYYIRQEQSKYDKSYQGEAVPFAKGELKHVIFGLRCEPEFELTVYNLLNKNSWSVSFHKAQEDFETLQMFCKPFIPPQISTSN